MTLRIGIIGMGIMGADHAETLHRSVSGARVSRAADLDLSRAETVAARLGATATDDPSALIKADDVDAVLIASHDSTHAGFVRECVAAGKPVLCEKPLSPTLAESAALIEDIGEDARLVTLGFMRRFDPGYAQIHAAVRDGSIGRPLIVHTAARTESSGPGSTTASSITNSLVHDLDVVPWLLGSPVTEVSWHAPHASAAEGFQDPHVTLLRTADGTLVTVETFLNAGYGYDIRCEVVGTGGTVALTEPVRTVRDAARQRGTGYAADWRPRFADAYRLELQAWIDSLTGGDPGPLASVRDGLTASAVADAVIRSMESGSAWVSV